MKKIFSVLAVLVLCLFLVSGCGQKLSTGDTKSNEHKSKPTSSSPVSVASFSPYFYKSDEQGMAVVLTNSAYASWIQLSPSENNRVYVELFLEENGTFSLSYNELQAAISDSTILYQETIKGEWKLAGDKITLSDVANLTKKTADGYTTISIGFIKDVHTAGLKGKSTVLKAESRIYTALD